MQSAVEFHSCVFSLKYRGSQFWKDLPLGSGFDVELTYTKDIKLDGDAIGIEHDMDLNSTLAKFLHLNRDLVQTRLDNLLTSLEDYRRETRRQIKLKQRTLSYRFLTQVYNWPLRPTEVVRVVEQYESDLRVRDLFAANEASLAMATQRMDAVGRSEITLWWFLFWDDFWRRNHDTINVLQRYEHDFNPHYATSIGYRPLPRPAMEAFLTQRGLLFPRAKSRQFVHHGLLNKIYFRMNQISFHNTDEVISFFLFMMSVQLNPRQFWFMLATQQRRLISRTLFLQRTLGRARWALAAAQTWMMLRFASALLTSGRTSSTMQCTIRDIPQHGSTSIGADGRAC